MYLEGIEKHIQGSLHSQSDLPLSPTPPHLMGQTRLINKKQIFVFVLPYISFIISFTVLEWIPYMESLYNQSGLSPDPLLWVKLRS